jgi:hypothetical protein
MAATVWSNVQVDVSSVLGAAIPITLITNADPGVLTHGGTDPADGTFVVLPDLEGMSRLRDRVSRVAGSGVGTLDLDGINTTLFGAFGSGSFQLITFGTSISTFTDVNASGGETNFADASVIHDDITREIPVSKTPFEMAFESIFDLGSASLLALKVLSDNDQKAAVRLTLSNGNIVVFYGYVSAQLLPTGATRDVIKTAVTIKASGALTGYAV